MLPPAIKSRPVYGTLVPDRTGRSHILVGEGEGGAALSRLLTDPTFPAGPRVILYAPSAATGRGDAIELGQVAGIGSEILPDITPLLDRLQAVLACSLMGTRLYAAGSESFLGAVMQLAMASGMKADERQGEHAGSAARRVRCTHCGHFNTDVITNLVVCAGCGRTLLVRDHYSQRLAAFMAVQIDAEIPGQVPETREVFR